jgi:hypothetical protein
MPLPRLPSSAEFLTTTPAATSPPEIPADDALALVRVIAASRGWRVRGPQNWIVSPSGDEIAKNWVELVAIGAKLGWFKYATWLSTQTAIEIWVINWQVVREFWPGCVQQTR